MTAVILAAILTISALSAQSATAQGDGAVTGLSAPTEVQTFRSAFDTFVDSDPQGFGVYDERDSSTFSPGEAIILDIMNVQNIYFRRTDPQFSHFWEKAMVNKILHAFN